MAESVKCPKCGSATVMRTVVKGPNAGLSFHVCTRYPNCKGRIPIKEKTQQQASKSAVSSGAKLEPQAEVSSKERSQQPVKRAEMSTDARLDLKAAVPAKESTPPQVQLSGISGNAELDLKAAISSINEIFNLFESLKDKSERTRTAFDEGEGIGGMWKGLKAVWSFAISKKTALAQIDQAIQLALDAKSANPDVVVTERMEDTEIELTPDIVIANGYLCKSRVYIISESLNEAQNWCQKSLSAFPTQEAQLLLSYIYYSQGQRREAISNFKRVIEMDSSSDEAVEARKALAEIDRMKPRKKSTALPLSILGISLPGLDRFYLGLYLTGFIKFITCGGFFVWTLLDIIRIATNNLRDANGMRLE